MSSSVNIDLCLISSANLLPKKEMNEIFLEAVNELGGKISNNILVLNGINIGKLSIGTRIVVQTYTENADFVKKSTEELRKIFTRRSNNANANYIARLEEERKRIEQSNLEFAEFEKQLNSINKSINSSKKAAERQKMSSCDAIKDELIESAINKGYDVVENNVNGEIQLQFIRREY